ncbi:MAG: ATPase [Rhodospirillaceae bacterium]|nr:MAG: ATPase [Rhodospirillaceae bacterium]
MPSANEKGSDARSTWALDREIVLSRVIAAPRSLVFKAWTDPRHLPRWFGPAGFKIETQEIDIRVGGRWRFVMVAPDGTRWDSRMVFLKVEAPHLLELDHGADKDDDPGRFRMIVTFEEQSDGKTVLTMRQLHPTVEQRNAGIGFGAVEFGYQTLDKLANHLTTMR